MSPRVIRAVALLPVRKHSERRSDQRTGGVPSLLLRLLGFPSGSCCYLWAFNIATTRKMCIFYESRKLHLDWIFVPDRHSLYSSSVQQICVLSRLGRPLPVESRIGFVLDRVVSSFASRRPLGRMLFLTVPCPGLCPGDPSAGYCFVLHLDLSPLPMHRPEVFFFSCLQLSVSNCIFDISMFGMRPQSSRFVHSVSPLTTCEESTRASERYYY